MYIDAAETSISISIYYVHKYNNIRNRNVT